MLIIFDCDGVLVESEELAAQIFSDLLVDIGIDMSPNMCFNTFKGRTLDYCYSWLEDHFHTALPKHFPDLLRDETQRRFTQELQPVPGVVAVLDYLTSAHIKFCVASNGGHEKIRNSLHVTGLLDYFPKRFSAEDVNEGKPKPDLFLLAAHTMGVDPKCAVVIEDSVSGYQAALAAEMRVLVYAQTATENFSKGRCFSAMSRLLDILPELK